MRPFDWIVFELALQLGRTVQELGESLTMGELAGWIEFLTEKNKPAKQRRYGTHRTAADDDEVLEPEELTKRSPRQIAAMFGAKLVQ